MRKMRKKNNRISGGFSLIELIVVIAIIMIAATGLITAFLSLSGWNVTQAASSIDSGLKNTRVLSMSRADNTVYFELQYNAGKYYMKSGEESLSEIANSSVVISYQLTDGTSVTVDASNPLKLYFNRSSGAFKSIYVKDDGSLVYCTSITITKGTYKKTVNLVPVTGKSYIE